jgi:hypothetical protein
MASAMKEAKFLSGKVGSHDLIRVSVVGSQRPQLLRAVVRRIYSARRGVDPRCFGEEIEFVRSPGHWGDVVLTVGDEALLFVASISDQLYEDPWHGHMLIDDVDGDEYASFPSRELWLRDDIPVSIRSSSRQDPKRPYATLIRLDVMEAYLGELISSG